MPTVSQISKNAKKIRRAGESWLSAIKRSSKQLTGRSSKPKKKTATRKRKKVGAIKKKVYQTGSSAKFYDEQRVAKKPGKRKTASGSTYTERRKNRSDMPGSLSGMKRAMGSMLDQQLAAGLLAREKATTFKQHKAAVKKINDARKGLRALK